jgi:F0F1-type ATP synthase delta subunit
MKITPAQYACALYESVKGKPLDDVKVAVRRLAEMLDRRQESRRLPQIIAAFENIWNMEENERPAEISSTRNLSDQEKEMIAGYWSKRSGNSGARLQFSENIDKELLGGFKLQAGGRLLDASLRTALESLKSRLAA